MFLWTKTKNRPISNSSLTNNNIALEHKHKYKKNRLSDLVKKLDSIEMEPWGEYINTKLKMRSLSTFMWGPAIVLYI